MMWSLSWKNIIKILGVGFLSFVSTSALAQDQSDPNNDLDNFSPKNTIVRDVCIIGGGSTGTFSAIRFRDQGKSVAVIERKNRLGGHTETYQDPVTGLKTEAGVAVWHNFTVVREYFARFSIPLVQISLAIPDSTTYVDFTTGKQINNTPSNPTQAFVAYAAQLAKYPFLDNGFDLPDPVPADLLLSFGDFVNKYNLHALVYTIFGFGEGLGNILAQPALYVLKNNGASILTSLSEGFLTTAHADNSELYVKALAELGSDVLLNSHVVATKRKDGLVKVLVDTPSGRRLIKAKKLLVTIPPKLDNLRGFDLDNAENSLFGQFNNSAYYTFVLRNTGIPENLILANIGANTSENIPSMPGIYFIAPAGIPNHVNVKYGSPTALPDEQVKTEVFAALTRLRTAGTVQTNTNPEIAFYSSHTPFFLEAPTAAIANGFYKKLNALQGHLNTFYTGAAWQTHDSSLLWRYTDTILPKVFG